MYERANIAEGANPAKRANMIEGTKLIERVSIPGEHHDVRASQLSEKHQYV